MNLNLNYINLNNNIVQDSVVPGNAKIQNYGSNMNKMAFVSGRGDGSLGVIREEDADNETTVRHTAVRSEKYNKSSKSKKKFSNTNESFEASPSTMKSKSKSKGNHLKLFRRGLY